MGPKYLKTAKAVSDVLKDGINYFNSNGESVVVGTSSGKKYAFNQRQLQMSGNYRSRDEVRSMASLTGADVGLITLNKQTLGKSPLKQYGKALEEKYNVSLFD
jgi:hypothetical protein